MNRSTCLCTTAMVALILAIGLMPVQPVAAKILRAGDVNGDNVVNINDIQLTVNVAIGVNTDPPTRLLADLNGDGVVNVNDVQLVVNIALGFASAAQEISISALDILSAVPGQLLTISGTNFDPNALLSAKFFDATGYSIVIPIVDATPTTLTVSVPPYIDPANGGFTAGIVTVQVLQASGTIHHASNMVTNFTIGPLPTASLPPGTVTLRVLDIINDILVDASSRMFILQTQYSGTLSTSQLVSYLNDLSTSLGILNVQIQSLMAGKTNNINLGQVNATPLTVNLNTLQITDQLMMAYLLALGPHSPDPCFGKDGPANQYLNTIMLMQDPTAVADAKKRYVAGVMTCGATEVSELSKRAFGWAGVLLLALSTQGVSLGVQASAALTSAAIVSSGFVLAAEADVIALTGGTAQDAQIVMGAITTIQGKFTSAIIDPILKLISPETSLLVKIYKTGKFLSGELQSLFSNSSGIVPAAPTCNLCGPVYTQCYSTPCLNSFDACTSTCSSSDISCVKACERPFNSCTDQCVTVSNQCYATCRP